MLDERFYLFQLMVKKSRGEIKDKAKEMKQRLYQFGRVVERLGGDIGFLGGGGRGGQGGGG